MTGYKADMQKATVFLHTSNKHIENKKIPSLKKDTIYNNI